MKKILCLIVVNMLICGAVQAAPTMDSIPIDSIANNIHPDQGGVVTTLTLADAAPTGYWQISAHPTTIDAWTKWLVSSHSAPQRGWINEYWYKVGAGSPSIVGSGIAYGTVAAAHAATPSVTFAAPVGTLVDFYIYDTPVFDNQGTLTLQVTVADVPVNPIPVPGAMLLSGLGTCLVGYFRMRRYV